MLLIAVNLNRFIALFLKNNFFFCVLNRYVCVFEFFFQSFQMLHAMKMQILQINEPFQKWIVLFFFVKYDIRWKLATVMHTRTQARTFELVKY